MDRNQGRTACAVESSWRAPELPSRHRPLSGRLPDQMQGDGPTGGAKIPGPGTSADAGGAPAPRIVGTGWASVVVAGLPAGAFTGSASPSPSESPAAGEQPLDAVRSVLEQLPTVSGSWGSGRVFSGTLFSVVLSDDGRIAVGAVAPERLFEALGTR